MIILIIFAANKQSNTKSIQKPIMIKKLHILVIAFLYSTSLFAQSDAFINNGPFKHLAIGLSLGSGGVGLDVATTLSDHFQARLGGEFMPAMTIGANVRTNDVGGVIVDGDGNQINLNYDMTFDAEPHISAANIIIDYYPFKKNSFHISFGAYLGRNKITAINDSFQEEIDDLKAVYEYNHTPDENGKLPSPVGIQMGEYLLEPDKNGRVNASFDATQTFQPYIGIGIGKSVPTYKLSKSTPYNKRVGYMLEIGARFWGTPKITCNDVVIDTKTLSDKGEAKMLHTLTSLPFYPVIKLRISGKIF